MMSKAKSKKPEDQVMVMLFTETVYALWKQRNRKLFDNNNFELPKRNIRST